MGYYTKFELEEVTGAEFDDVMNYICEQMGFDPFKSEWKWYSHEEDMKKFSTKFSGATIITSGVGEEYPDIWKSWFKDGKSKTCQATMKFYEPEEYE